MNKNHVNPINNNYNLMVLIDTAVLEAAEQRKQAALEVLLAAKAGSDEWRTAVEELSIASQAVEQLREIQGSAQLSRSAAVDEPNTNRAGSESVGESSVARPAMASRAESSPQPDTTVEPVSRPVTSSNDQGGRMTTVAVGVTGPNPNEEPTAFPGLPEWIRVVLTKKGPDARRGIARGGRGANDQEDPHDEPSVTIHFRVRVEDLPDWGLISEISRWAPDILFGTWGRLMRWINHVAEPDEVKERIIDQWCKIQTMPWQPVLYQYGHDYTRLNQRILNDEARRSLVPTTPALLMCYEYAHKHNLGTRTLHEGRVMAWPKARPPSLEEQMIRDRVRDYPIIPEHGSPAMVALGCGCAICTDGVLFKATPKRAPPPPPAKPIKAPPPPLPERVQDAVDAAKAVPKPLPPVDFLVKAEAKRQQPPMKAPPAKGQIGVIANAGCTPMKAPPPHIHGANRSDDAPDAEPAPAPAATAEATGPAFFDIGTPPLEQPSESTASKVRFAEDTNFEVTPRRPRTKDHGLGKRMQGAVSEHLRHMRAYNALNLEPASPAKVIKKAKPAAFCGSYNCDCGPHCPPPTRDAASADCPEPQNKKEDSQVWNEVIEVFKGCCVSRNDAVLRQAELVQVQLVLEKELEELLKKDIATMEAAEIIDHYAEADELVIKLERLRALVEKEKPNALVRAKTYLQEHKAWATSQLQAMEAPPGLADSQASSGSGLNGSSDDEREKKVKTQHEPYAWPAASTAAFPPATSTGAFPPANPPPPPKEAPPADLDMNGYPTDPGDVEMGLPPFKAGEWVEGEDFSKVEKWLRSNYRVFRLGEMNNGRAMDPISFTAPQGERSPYQWGKHTESPPVTNECLPHMGDGQPANTLWQNMAKNGFNPVVKRDDDLGNGTDQTFWDSGQAEKGRLRRQLEEEFPEHLYADDGYDEDGPGFHSLQNVPSATTNPMEQSLRLFALPCTMNGHVGIRQRYTRYQLLELVAIKDINVDQGPNGQYVAEEGTTLYCCSACFHRREGVENGALHKEFIDLVRWQMAKEHFPRGAPDDSVEVCRELAGKSFEKLDTLARKDPDSYPDWFGPLKRSKRDFVDLCRVMCHTGRDQAPDDWPVEAKHLASLIVYEMSNLSKRLGQSRMAMMGLMTDFCRNIFLRPGHNLAQQRFYVCPHCLRIPKKDRVWFVCRYKQNNNRFFCAACGKMWTDVIGDELKEDSGHRFSYLHTIQIDDKVLMIPCGQPPQGSTNVMEPIILANAAYMGLFDMGQFSEDQSWEHFIEVLVQYSCGENLIADQALDMNDVRCEPLPLRQPEKGMIRRGPAVFTMGPTDIGSYAFFYDLNSVKHLLMPPKVSKYWLIVTNFLCLFITASMGAAILASPQAQGKGDLAKRLRRIGGNAVVRENQAWPEGEKATEAELRTARTEMLFPEVEEETRIAWDTAQQTVSELKRTDQPTALYFLKAAFVLNGVEQAAVRAQGASPVNYADEYPDILTGMIMTFFFLVLIGSCYLSDCVGYSRAEKITNDGMAKELKEAKEEASKLELTMIRRQNEFDARRRRQDVDTIPQIQCKNQQTDYTHTSVRMLPYATKKGRFWQIKHGEGCI